ncbi:MAG: zonular occludens toxin domain-containing protein [Formivibrio sp.]|nr:zonular occludens toxin domain-containing protein [Formivibrio sp.]
MLINHEGIPGSGKTFEAVVKHLVPALKQGRKIFARIDGLNYPQLAKLADISVDYCQELLVHVDEEHIHKIDEYVMPNGSLVLIDELQNYFPNIRKPLSPGVTKFVAEHRHLGLDIVFMCQDLKDVHSIWRRRVDTKIVFSKLDSLGFPSKYSWKLYKAVSPEKFKEVSSGQGTYDKAVFGSYKSFEAGAEKAQTYADKRRSIWSSKLFSRWVPLALIAGVAAVWYLFHLFMGGGLEQSLTPRTSSGTPRMSVPAAPGNSGLAAVPVAGQAPGVAAGPAPAPPEKKKYERDFIEDLSEKYHLRISGVAKSATHLWGVLEWYDDGLRVKERLSFQAVTGLGYVVAVDDRLETATITKDKVRYVATQFPLDPFGQVSDERQRQIAGHEHGADLDASGDPSSDSVAMLPVDRSAPDGSAPQRLARPPVSVPKAASKI